MRIPDQQSFVESCGEDEEIKEIIQEEVKEKRSTFKLLTPLEPDEPVPVRPVGDTMVARKLARGDIKDINEETKGRMDQNENKGFKAAEKEIAQNKMLKEWEKKQGINRSEDINGSQEINKSEDINRSEEIKEE